MRMNRMKTLILLLLSQAMFLACTNISEHSATVSTTGNPAFVPMGGATSGSYTHLLKNIVPDQTANQNGAAGNYQLSLSVDAGQANFKALTQFCGLGGVNPCGCELKWTQSSSDGTTSFDRTRRLTVASIQSGMVTCSIPASDWGEIAIGTSITMNIVPLSGNMTGLNVKPLIYKKGTSADINGDFLDSTLTPFRNIQRYTCHSKRSSTYEILNKYVVSTDPNGNEINTIVGSCFCTGSSPVAGNANNGGGGGGACAALQCPNNLRTGYSSQNYYRNFYIRSDKVGLINSTNATYDCPKVLESVKVSAKSNSGLTTVPTSEQRNYWPLDATFALATQYSSDWSIGISAASILTKPGDVNTTTPDPCVNSGVGFIENGVFPKCLGYARKPKADGTCGSIQDSNGRTRPLVRLRRYRAVLPARFDADGKPEGAGNANTAIYPAVDEVYVADRLVLDSNGTPTGDLIYGPKPCHYSWFDHEGVVNRESPGTGASCTYPSAPNFGTVYPEGNNDFGSNLNKLTLNAQPQYISTTKFYKGGVGTVTNPWSESLSVNPDGMIFPNRDYYGGGVGALDQAFCSASLPVVNYSMGAPNSISLFTSYRNRLATDAVNLGSKVIYKSEIHLRPIDPWAPQYLEDTSFQACAPIADPYVEPPLHFYKDTNKNLAWCAEVYPNQNPYWATLNKKRRITAPAVGYDNTLVNYKNNPGASSCNGAFVRGYTLHTDSIGLALGLTNRCTGTPAKQICKMTDPTATGCEGFLANYDSHKSTAYADTCDRTVMFDPFQEYQEFPLQASDADIDEMLKNDLSHVKSFACTYSVSSDPSKINKKYPSTGCCGKYNGQVVLNSLQLGTATAKSGHLEPLVDPIAPNIRYCGSPVK